MTCANKSILASSLPHAELALDTEVEELKIPGSLHFSTFGVARSAIFANKTCWPMPGI